MPNYKVTEKSVGTRLDIFLSKKLKDYSRAYLQKLIVEQPLVNKEHSRASYKLRLNDKIHIDLQKGSKANTEKIDIPIIYEDSDCLVINKPLGILSHSKGKFSNEATVETFIADKITGFDGDRAGIVHRLDRATSGVMICAKNPTAYKLLQKEFSTRKVKKVYAAVVTGHLSDEEAIIDMPIARNPRSPSMFRVNSNGKEAITRYKVKKTSDHYSLLELAPKTGRTHQLRVHLSHMGHPIVGDTFYNGKKAERLYLHAQSLEIRLPDNQIHTFEVEYPSEFNKLLSNDNE